MTDNRFADCNTPEEVLWVWRKLTDGTSAVVAIPDALARIRELTPPGKPVVSEKARERALSAVLSAMREARNAGPDIPSANWWLYRIIDALGYTEAAESKPLDNPAPASPPVVDLAPDELRWLADIVEDYERLYNRAALVVEDDSLPPMFYLHLRDAGAAGAAVRVVCGENCWVLRIGGEQ